MKQKFLLFLLCSSLLCGIAKAAESEPNDTKAQANTLALNGNNSGAIGASADEDWWKITTNGDGKLDVVVTSTNGQYIRCYIYDNNGTAQLNYGETNGSVTVTTDGLATGTYYVRLISYYSGGTPTYTISNALTFPAQANDAEPNGNRALAKVLSLNSSTTGHVNYYYNNVRDTFDYYKITTNGDGKLRLRVTSGNGQYIRCYIYDNNGTTQLNYGETNGTVDINTDGLATGTYYVRLEAYYTSSGFVPYTIADSLFKPVEVNDAEPNDSKATALTLPLNGSVTGHANYYYNLKRDSSDWFKVTTNSDGRIRLRLTSGNGQFVWAYLYDNNGTTQLNAQYTNSTVDINTDGLAAGTYYVKVRSYYDNGFIPYTLADSLFVPAQANDNEPNNSKAQALDLAVNSTVTGHVDYFYNNQRDSSDWYKIVTPKDGMVQLKLVSGNGQYIFAYLYSENGTTELNNNYTNSTLILNTDGLAEGTYYVKIRSYYNDGYIPYILTDSLFTYTYVDDKKEEPNDVAGQAKTLFANQGNDGHVGFYEDNNTRNLVDWWKINYTGSGALNVTMYLEELKTGGINYTYMQVYKDTSLTPIFSNYTNGSSLAANFGSLTQGYYWVKVYPYYDSKHQAYSLVPTFTQVNVAKIKILSYDTVAVCDSANKITFKCSQSSPPYVVQLYRFGLPYGNPVTTNQKVTFKNLPSGSYYARVYGDGATGTAFNKSKTAVLEPVPTGLNTTNITDSKAKLNWSAVECADYYTVQYKEHSATDWITKKTDGNETSYSLKNLTPGTSYDWRVATSDTANGLTATGDYADSISFITNGGALIAGGNNDEDNLKVNGNTKAGSLLITPNPATSYFTIRYNGAASQKLSAQLFDVNGKAVWSSGLISSGSLNGKQVNVSQFAKGVFQLKITNESGVVTGTAKVIVAK